MAEFKRDRPQDECDQHEEERDVKRTEEGSIDMRERCKHRTACRDHPDLVAVPDGTDRADDLRAVALLIRDNREKCADTVVKSLEEEEPREEHSDEHKPENIVIHVYFPPSMAGVICVRRMKRKAM